MKTEIIIATEKALKDIEGVKQALEALAKIDFSNISNAMDSIGKSLNDVKKSAKDATDAQKNQSKTLMGELKQQIKAMQELYTKDPNIVKNDPNKWNEHKDKLVNLTRQVAQMEEAINSPIKALNHLRNAFGQAWHLKNIKEVSDEFKEMTKKAQALRDAMKSATSNSQADMFRLENLKALLKKQNLRMETKYSRNPNEVNTSQWEKDVAKLAGYTRRVAEMEAAMGRPIEAFNRLKKGLQTVVSSSDTEAINRYIKSMQDIGTRAGIAKENLKQLEDQIKALSTQSKNQLNAKAQVQAKKEIEQQQKANERQLKYEIQLRAAAEKATARQRQQIETLQRKYNEFRSSIANHTGEGQAFFTQRQFTSMEKQMQDIVARAEKLKHILPKSFTDNLGSNLSSMLNGTNVKSGINTRWAETLQQRMSRLNEEASRFYGQWQKTKNITDLLRFRGVVQDLRDAQKEADKLDKAINHAFSLKRFTMKPFEFLENRAKWAMSGLAANIVWDIPSETLQSYVELERAMAGVQQVLPLIEGKSSEVNKEFERLNTIAADFGRNSKDVVEAAQLWGRGYGKADVSPFDDEMTKYQKEMEAMKTTNELVRQSAILATVDNFGMAESVRGLEAVLAAYGMRAKSAAEATLFAGRAVDIITKVSHTGQISAQELVAGLEATGKAAEQAGVSLSFLTALIETGVRNTGMSGSNIGNAIKSMMVGLQSDKAAEEMRKFGVEVTKVGEDGVRRMRPMEDVILEVAAALRTGDVNAKNLLLRISGGKQQFSKVSAILRDGAEIMRMWGEASTSAGFAQKQLEVQINTFAVKLERLRADLAQLAQDIATSGAGEALKKLLDIADSFLKDIHEGGTSAKSIGLVIALGTLTIVGLKAFSSLNKLTGALGKYNTFTQTSGTLTTLMSMALNRFKLATNMQTRAQQAQTLATKANTIAVGADTVAQEARNVVMAQGVALQAALTLGLNILIAAVVGYTAYTSLLSGETDKTAKSFKDLQNEWNGISDKTGKTNENLKALASEFNKTTEQIEEENKKLSTNNELLEKNAERLKSQKDAITERVHLIEQGIQAEQDTADWLEKGGKMYMTYKKAVDDTNTSDEKRKELTKELEMMKTKFIGVLDKEEAQMLENASTNEELEETFVNLANTHREKAKAQQADLNALLTKQAEYYAQQVKDAGNEATRYENSLKSFYNWTFGQIEGLSLWESAWAHAYKFWAGIQRGLAEGEQKIADSMKATYEKARDAFGEDNPITQESKEAYETWQKLADTDNADADRAIENSTEDLRKYLNQAKKQEAEFTNELINARKQIMSTDRVYGAEGGDTGSLPEDDKKGKKERSGSGHHKKQQIAYTTDLEKIIHNAMADGAFSDDGWTHSLLKALVDYNGGDISNLSKVIPDLKDYFRQGANQSDPYEIGYAFQQFALNNATKKGWEGVIEQVYGAAADTVKAKLKNDAEWIDNNFTWKNSYKGIYGETLNVLDGLKQGMSAWVGKSMDLAGVGCVEAVEKIGSFYSEFLKEQFDANVRYIPTLLENAKKQGIDVVAFDESKLEVGDLVTWANPGDYNNHIGIFTGYKDGKAMVADNSSGENKILERELYRSWQAVESIVKTGKGGKGSQIPWVNSRKKDSIYEWDGDRKNRADNKVKEQYKWQEKEYEIAVERAKLEQEFTGDTISYQKAINQLRELHIKQMSNYIDERQEAYDKGTASLNAYINNSKTIQAALKRAKVTSFNDLSEAEQKDLLDMNAKNGDDRAKNAVKIYEMLKQIKEEIPKAKLNLRQEKNALRADNGDMKPEDRYKWQKQLVNDWDATSHDNRLLQADRNLELDLVELQRLQGELAKAKQENETRINEKLAERLALETEIAKLSQKETLTDKDKEKLEGLKAAYKELGEDIQDLKVNGQQTYRDLTQKVNAHTKATRESAEEVQRIANEYKQAGADITVDFFDKLINEGASLGDAIESLRKEIAKIAIKWFTYKAFNLPINNETFGNSPLETLLVHSQNKGEQDMTPTGLNTTATLDNTKALERLSAIISRNPQVLTGANPSMGGLINNPAIYNYGMQGQNPAISQMTSTLQTLVGNIPIIGNHLSTMAGNLPQMVMQYMQEKQLEQQKLIQDQQGMAIAQQSNMQEQANTSAMYTLQAALDRNTTSNNMPGQGGAGGLGGGLSGEAGGETSGFGGLFGSLSNIFGLFTGSINQNTAQLTENTAGLDKTGDIFGKLGGGGAGGLGGMGMLGGLLGFLPMILALLFQGDKKGGSLEKFAKGGKPTNGLIKGAGTGTSDSILTYLQHKKKFIRTSDGEYIINAKATDKLGVGTLDAINKNPELFNEMLLEKKGLATGGSVDYVPTMKPSTANTYKSYTQTKASMSNPNGRMEELMAEQNGLISGIGQGNNGQIVVLNTQADSNAVMKAIHDNPKAFRNLLGQQKKRGFQ